MNKGKKGIKTIDGKSYPYIFCNRCQVWIPKKEWENDTHKNCDEYLRTKPIRDKVHKKLFGGKIK